MVFFLSWWHHWLYGANKLSALHAYATSLPANGPYNSVQLGMLKQLDQMVNDLEKKLGTQVHLNMILRERAMAALPENTAALLRRKMVSSEVALELVRRDMTEYSLLSAGLTRPTAEDLEKDPVLKKIHDRLSMAVQLHGVLTLAGINPAEREWAQTLVDTFIDLKSLRATPWSEVAWLLGLIELSPETDEGEPDAESPVPEGLKNTYDNPPTDTELRIIRELYSIGEGAPPIRAQVLAYRMTLDVADELESMNIYDASQMKESDQRILMFRIQQRVEDEQKAAEDAAGSGGEGSGGGTTDGGDSKPPTGSAAARAFEPPTAELRTIEPDVKPRALPALAAVTSKLLPVAAAAVPKLIQGSKLTLAASGGSSGLTSLGKNLSAMLANATNAGSSATASKNSEGSKAGSAVSGLVPARLAAVGGTLDAVSKTADSATGAVQSLKGLYSELTPDVEAQVAAIEQEKARLNVSLDYVREELEKVDLSTELQGSLDAAQAAIDRAKAEVAPDPNFGAKIAEGSSLALQQALIDQRLSFGSGPVGLGSYATNEELVAKASGGLAMYGMNFFPTAEDIVIKPYAPILENPSFVEMTGAVSPFEAKVEKTTSQTKAAAFHNTSSNAGISVAQTVTSTRGGSASASVGIFASASASGSSSSATSFTNNQGQTTSSGSQSSQESSTTSATIIEYIRCPMKSFRIPVREMSISAAAYAAAVQVDTIEKGEDFLDNYGSHISTGRQELGGVFFTTITLTSEKSQSAVSMMSAASRTSETIKQTSRRTEAGGGASFLGFGGKAASSFGLTTSTGVARVSGTASAEGSEEASETAQYESYVRCVGPNTPTPETFAEALLTDTSTWAVTDRGRLEAMVPVTVLLQKAASEIVVIPGSDSAEILRKKFEIAILFVKAAWRRRAKFWGYLLQDDPNLDVPTPVLNLIKSAFPSSLGRVPTLLKALTDSLIIRHTGKPLNLDPTEEIDESDFSAEVKMLVQNIVLACKNAEAYSNSFPVELPFLDAEGLEKQVTKEIVTLQEANKNSFTAVGITYKDGTFEVAEGVELEKLEESWNTAEATKTLWGDLEEWQRKWVQQTIEQGGEWNSERYELFQRRYFSEDQSSDFIEELNKLITADYPTGEQSEPTTFLTVKLSTKEAKKEALQRAVSRMLKADWVVMADLWLDDENGVPEFNDEFGPEGDALWTKLLNGVGLFEAMKYAENEVADLSDPTTDEAQAVYDRELKVREQERDASIALADLLTYKWTEEGVTGGQGVPDADTLPSFSPFALPGEETINKALERLRGNYNNWTIVSERGNEWEGANESEETWVGIRQQLESLSVDLGRAVVTSKNNRQLALQKWEDAIAQLQEATSRYNNIFPEE